MSYDSAYTDSSDIRKINKVYEEYDQFIKKTDVVIGSMCKTFEKKRNARAEQKRSHKKTGVLDVKRLSQYRFTDDLFRKRTTVPNQTSHSVHVLLDWSGSITGSVLPMVKQAINLARFCRKAGIMYRVCCFTDSYYDSNTSRFENNMRNAATSDLMNISDNYSILEFLSSDLKRDDFNTACKYLYLLAYMNSSRNNHSGNLGYIYNKFTGMGLGGTPLVASLIGFKGIVDVDIEKHRIQNPNLIVITDGMSGNISFKNQDGKVSFFSEYKTKTVMIDPKSNKQYNRDDYVNSYKNNKSSSAMVTFNNMISNWYRNYGVNAIQIYLDRGTTKSMVSAFMSEYGCNEEIIQDMKNSSAKMRMQVNDATYLENFVGYNKSYFINPFKAFGEVASNYYDYNDEESEDGSLDIKIDTTKTNTVKSLTNAFTNALSEVNNQKLIGELIVTDMCEKI